MERESYENNEPEIQGISEPTEISDPEYTRPLIDPDVARMDYEAPLKALWDRTQGPDLYC